MAAKKKWMGGGVNATWQTTQDAYNVGSQALRDLDAVRHQMRLKWGDGRLPLIVPQELAQKFWAQAAKTNHAEWHGSLDDLLTACRRSTNAWRALDRAATDAGHGPADAGLWEVTLANGTMLRVARTDADVLRAPPGGVVWSMQEVARLVDAQDPVVVALKQTFVGATVAEVAPVRQPPFRSDEPGDIR